MKGRRLLAAVITAAGLTVLGSAPPAAAAGSAHQAAEATVQGGVLRAVVSTGALPPDAVVDTAGVRVTAGGRHWSATAEVVGSSAVAPVRRSAVMAVDTSGSMGTGGIAAAQAAANGFLDVVPGDVLVGLVTFSDQATLLVAPTTDRQALRAALGSMRPAGNTRLYDGIGVALDALGSDGDRAVVVLSDGKDTASATGLDAIRHRLSSQGVRPSFVAFRTEEGQVDVLRDLAVAGGGRVDEAATGSELAEVFVSAGRGLVQDVVVTAEVPSGVVGATDVRIEIPTGADLVVASARVDVPVAATAALPSSQVATPGAWWSKPIVLGGVFVGLFLLFVVALNPATWRGTASQQRSRDVERYALTGAWSATPSPAAAPSTLTQTALGWADRAVQSRELTDDWTLKLDRAALPLKPHEWLLIRVSVTLAAVALAVLLLPWWFLTGLLAAVTAWIGTGLYVRIRASRRTKRFADRLPDMLQLTAGSLRSGFSLPQAIDNAAKDGEEPIAGELSRALAESRLGVPLEDALDRVAHRMASTDLRWTVMAIRIARDVGGNLAEVLLSTTETMRERARVKRQVKALSAEGKLSAYILLALPAGITLLMVLFRRSYISVLVTDPIGWVMVTYALVSVTVGAWFMSRIVKLEV